MVEKEKQSRFNKIAFLFNRQKLFPFIFFGLFLFIIIFGLKIIPEMQKFISRQAIYTIKSKNDSGINPKRNIIVNYKNKSNLNYQNLDNLPLNPRRAKPKMFLSDMAPQGYRVIYGVFDFLENLHGAILLDPAGEVVNIWKINKKGSGKNYQKDFDIFPHGFEIFPDGSIITTHGPAGSTLTKYDYCGNIIWRLYGYFHHAISYDGGDSIWVIGDTRNDKEKNKLNHNNLLKVDINTGRVLQKTGFQKVMDNNSQIDIFGILQITNKYESRWIQPPGEEFFYWHPNDIDPLPEKLEKFYPNFKAGDLLASLRNPNLIFIFDPNTLKVKWWRQGLTRRQHDPDWNTKGTITIYNNNMHQRYSSIVEIDPVTYEYNIPIKGEEYNFYSRVRGKHDVLPNKGYLITSSQQGRVFEVNENGDVTFEFLNMYDEEKDEYLALSEARFLPIDFFENLSSCK